MTKYILRLSNNPESQIGRAGLTNILEKEGITVLEPIAWELFNFFGHVIEIPDSIGKSIDDVLKLIPGALRIYPINTFKLQADPKLEATEPSSGTVVTIDQTWKELGFQKIWGDPDFNGGEGIIIGSCDTGVSQQHNGEYPFQDGPAGITPYPPKKRILARKDYFQGETPDHPHGTWTTEIFARSPRQDGTWRGACYRASIVDARVLNPEGQGSTLTVADGLHWLATQNVDVVNVSLGGPHDEVLNEAIEALWNQGIICCAATGNSGHYPPDCDGMVGSPGDAENAVACGASSVNEQDDTHKNQWYVQSWTSRGKRWNGTQIPHYTVAPGLYLEPGWSDQPNSGTSFSAPHHTGTVAALCKKAKLAYPDMTKTARAQLVRDALDNNAVSLGYDTSGNHTKEGAYCLQGFGRIAPDLAYAAIAGVTPPPPSGRQFNPAQSAQFTVTVSPLIPPPAGKEDATLTSGADKNAYKSGDDVTITAILRAKSDNAPIVGRQVTIAFGISSWTAATDATGTLIGVFRAPDVQQDTQFTGQASFAGD